MSEKWIKESDKGKVVVGYLTFSRVVSNQKRLGLLQLKQEKTCPE